MISPYLNVEYSKYHYTRDDERYRQIVLERELFLEEDAAPYDRGHAVRGDDGRSEGDVLGVGKGVDIEELADGLEYRAGVLRGFLPEDELLLLYAEGVYRARDTGGKEGQLVGNVCGVLIEDFGCRQRCRERQAGSR